LRARAHLVPIVVLALGLFQRLHHIEHVVSLAIGEFELRLLLVVPLVLEIIAVLNVVGYVAKLRLVRRKLLMDLGREDLGLLNPALFFTGALLLTI